MSKVAEEFIPLSIFKLAKTMGHNVVRFKVLQIYYNIYVGLLSNFPIFTLIVKSYQALCLF